MTTFRCPYTDVCKAQALQEFANAPEIVAVIGQRLQCNERDSEVAQRCPRSLGLAESQFPTFGQYVQQQRRAKDIPQAQFASKIGVELQELRELEVNKLDPQLLAQHVIEKIAITLESSIEYLRALSSLTRQAGMPRQGTVFARRIISHNEPPQSS